MQFIRGMRDKLANHLNQDEEVTVEMSISGNAVYDFCCFGVDRDKKLSDERYMIFYNQTSSPMNEILYIAGSNSAVFKINLGRLPQTVDRLIFTASIDGNGVMGEITKHTFTLSQNGAVCIDMELAGSDFRQEKAIISMEFYRKEEWRISAVANGFNGGLAALLNSYGGTEEVNTPGAATPQVQPPAACSDAASTSSGVWLKKNEEQLTKEVMGKISLSKDKVKLEKHVVSLSKCVVDLSKKNGVDLGSVRAKVVVALDYSGSMTNLYRNGTVQKTINRLVPLGLTFDDNGSIDVYLFQNDYRKIQDLNLSNYENYVKNVIMNSGYTMGGTNYAPVLRAIIEGDVRNVGGFFGFGGRTEVTKAIVDDKDPTFILFITDGANADKHDTDQVIRRSSEMNVFIQFVGIGNEKFDYLAKLDDLAGRKRDNTGFTKMKALDNVSDDQLYTKVLEQFSQWLKGLQ